jgi:sulfite reductase beta subunit
MGVAGQVFDKKGQVQTDIVIKAGGSIDGKPVIEDVTMPLADPEGDGIAILVGGKISNSRSAPKFSKLVIPFLPNTPPRWPETVAAVKNILEVYAKDAKKYERVGEWAERIGWEKFFEKCNIPFTDKSIDDYRLAYDTWRTTTQFKFTSHIK